MSSPARKAADEGARHGKSKPGTDRKPMLLRVDPQVHAALTKWAADDLRSTNAHVEWLLRRALLDAGRLPPVKGPTLGVVPDTPDEPASPHPPGRGPTTLSVNGDDMKDTTSRDDDGAIDHPCAQPICRHSRDDHGDGTGAATSACCAPARPTSADPE